jgi:hypothetical protein
VYVCVQVIDEDSSKQILLLSSALSDITYQDERHENKHEEIRSTYTSPSHRDLHHEDISSHVHNTKIRGYPAASSRKKKGCPNRRGVKSHVNLQAPG